MSEPTPWPGFVYPDDWREAANDTCTERDGLRLGQWVADAKDDHDNHHGDYSHPWCLRCETRSALQRARESLDDLDDCAVDSLIDDAGRRVDSRALRYLRLHGRPPRPEPLRVVSEPFDAGTLTEILARPSEPPMRADGLIPSDASALLVAQRKTGKTTAELNYARSLLTGEPLLGTFDVRPLDGRVALLNYEVSAAQIGRWAHEHAVPADRLVLVNLRGRRNPLTDAKDRAELAAYLRSHDTEAVIVDPFGRAFNGASQNDSGEVGAWLVDLDRFVRSEVGATDLMLSAHAGWNGERTRGASALEDWADVVITMTRGEDEDGHRYLRAMGRDVDIDEDRLLFDPATRTLTLSGQGSRKAGRDSRKAAELAVLVVRAARQQPGLSYSATEASIREMDDNPGFRNGDISKAARFAQEQGQLTISAGPRGAAALFANDITSTSPTSPHLSHGRTPHLSHLSLEGEVEVGGSAPTAALPLDDTTTDTKAS